MKDTKRARIIRELKQSALNASGGISRAEAAEKLGIDLRTAAVYLEELASGGLLRSETVPCAGKGRPHSVYRSNADNLSFLGLQIAGNFTASAVLIDSVGRKLTEEKFALPENGSRLSVFSTLLDVVSKYKIFQNKRLYAVGLAISRWLQPPLAGEDVYANLTEYLQRESSVAVYRDVNINAVSFAAGFKHNCRNLAIVHPGRVIEFGLVLDGVPDKEFTKREAWLSHLCVNPDGNRCYCGKYGCLENYVTFGARTERINPANAHIVTRALGNMLGVAMVRIARKYPLEKIILYGADELFPAAEEYFSQKVGNPCKLCLNHQLAEVDYGAALLAAHYELYRYTR
ncbi:MAG: ROK family protein [Lentisphaerae bacterium]|nr:ROK family protein [Lentisphaerota bacterium]